MSEPEVLFERRGRLGLMTLNRPRALNTLTLAMVRAIDAQLRTWAGDPAIAAVAITGAGGRAFCAGGDVRALYELGVAGRYAEALTFWREEYALNALIKGYPKPYVALIEGIVMGGGAGVSIHGSHRVAIGEIAFAMPEAGIGFFPDVGATFFLPRLASGVGMYLALTGRQIGAADALMLGVLTHHVAAGRADAVVGALGAGAAADDALAALSSDPGAPALADRLPAVARLFHGSRVEDIIDALEREAAGGGPAADLARDAAAAIGGKSPSSLCIAFEQMRRGNGLGFSEAMRTEYRIVSRRVRHPDLYEGIRAVVIDKGRAPRWSPASLAGVADADIEAYFAALPEELAEARANGASR